MYLQLPKSIFEQKAMEQILHIPLVREYTEKVIKLRWKFSFLKYFIT